MTTRDQKQRDRFLQIRFNDLSVMSDRDLRVIQVRTYDMRQLMRVEQELKRRGKINLTTTESIAAMFGGGGITVHPMGEEGGAE